MVDEPDADIDVPEPAPAEDAGPVDADLPPDAAYVPGACNIGDAEAANRRRYGYTGLFATIALWAIVLALGLNPWILVLLVFPGFLMATGFIQARSHFCSGFGMHGMSNFTDTVGSVRRTTAGDQLLLDRARAREIIMRSVAIGAIVAVIGVLSAIFF